MAVDGGQGLRRNQGAQDDRRMEVWIHMADSTLCLSSPASGSPSDAALGAHTVHSIYPGADKGG
jgi:hypothetical protein